MDLLASATREPTLLISYIMILGHESDHATIGIESNEIITIKVEAVLQDLHLHRTRGIAIANTIGDVLEVELDFHIHLLLTPFVLVIVIHDATTIGNPPSRVNRFFIQQSKIASLLTSAYTHTHTYATPCLDLTSCSITAGDGINLTFPTNNVKVTA